MKNSVLRFCLLLMLAAALLLPCMAVADTANGALDLVILLDNSGSMYKTRSGVGNDFESFRYDAASIMLNMCEATGSRAAVYEFYGDSRVSAIPRKV